MTKSTPSCVRSFVSVVKQNLCALKNLDKRIESWDPILISILTRKLDQYTARAYQLDRDQDEEPSVSELLDFLEKRALAMENSDSSLRRDWKVEKSAVHIAAVDNRACLYCKLCDHKIFNCPQFKLLPISQRISYVNEKSLCKICLNAHRGRCKFHFRCGQCKQNHNTLIHPEEVHNNQVTLLSSCNDSKNVNNTVLLPTVRVKLVGQNNQAIHIKAILDSASQVSLVTHKIVKTLGLKPLQSNSKIIGVTNAQSEIKYSVPLDIHSLTSPFSTSVSCHVVDQITCQLPQNKIDISKIEIPPNIILADAEYHIPSEINMLIGADVFFQVILPPATPQVQTSTSQPLKNDASSCHLQPVCTTKEVPNIINTCFGHVIGGSLPSFKTVSNFATNLCLKCDDDLSETISNFWKTETVPEILSEKGSEQEITENIFQSSVKLENNRFCVDLPLKVPLADVNGILGNSFDLALTRFINLEKKLQRSPFLLTEYQKFIDEYVNLGHGHYFDIASYDFSREPIYFLPHHAVFNENSKTTRTRVVFDGSMKTNKRVSLNDILLNGPVVQNDLFDIVMLYRIGNHTFSTDIKRMFRNVLVSPQFTSLTNILWRDNPSKPIQCIRLDTVTYGLKSSTYLATRCLYELANRYEDQFPLASFIIKNCTYVDDILYSNSDTETILKAKQELCELLSMGGFETHKWSSNSTDLLSDIPVNRQQFDNVDLQKNECYMKTLGLNLDVIKDRFIVTCPESFDEKTITKREVLSYISKFYDPLGFVSPIIVKAKSIMQKLWSEELAWHDSLSKKLADEWLQFTNSLAAMEPIYINRNIQLDSSVSAVQLIGFADASSSTGYGCCIYLRTVHKTGESKLYLLCSKSRINPCSKPLTIPRLELNANLLLAKLMNKVYTTLKTKINIDDVYLFSDSKIALAWLETEPTKLLAYVSNRVRVIQELTNR